LCIDFVPIWYICALDNFFMPRINIKYTGIDVFSGAGGMSLGAEMAGINVALAIENNEHAAETFRHNHPKSIILNKNIQNIRPQDVVKFIPFILFGGPPCQGFSLSNTKTRNTDNTNNSLFEEFIRFVKELNPKWILFENVEGFENFNNGKIVDELQKRLAELGYISSVKVLCASDYGVPQNRNRFFLVGNRLGKAFHFPTPTKKKITVHQALIDLPKLKNGANFQELPYRVAPNNAYLQRMRKGSKKSLQNIVSRNKEYVIDRYNHIKPGENWKSIPDHLMLNYKNKSNCHSGIYRRLHPDKPSVVISNYRKNMLIHPSENRGLSVREAARLQSFPDNFIFKGPLMHIQQQIGNAVPPFLAYSVFKNIIHCHNARTKQKKRK